MRLALTVPDTWRARRVGEQHVAVLPVAEGRPEILLAWGWLVPYPDQVQAWVSRALHADVASDAIVKVGPVDIRTTNTGWPLWIVPAEIALAGGTVVEHRIGAFYTFLEYGAVALLRARDRAALDLVRAAVLEVLATGSPAWQADGLPVCLHDLFAPHA